VSGLVAGDSVSGLSQAFDSRNAGSRSLVVGSGYTVNDGSGGGNYTVVTNPATGSIVPAPLTITADEKSRDAGQAKPAADRVVRRLRRRRDGGRAGGTLSLATSANAASPAGLYSIVPTGQSSQNYAIRYVNGTLTVLLIPAAASSSSAAARHPRPRLRSTLPWRRATRACLDRSPARDGSSAGGDCKPAAEDERLCAGWPSCQVVPAVCEARPSLTSDDERRTSAPPAGAPRLGAGWRRLALGATVAALLALAPLPPARAQTAAAPTFQVQRFSVEGNTLLDPVQIDAAWPNTSAARAPSPTCRRRWQRFSRPTCAPATARCGPSCRSSRSLRARSGSRWSSRARPVAIDGPPGSTRHGSAAPCRSLREGETPNADDLGARARAANENPSRLLGVDLRSDARAGSTRRSKWPRSGVARRRGPRQHRHRGHRPRPHRRLRPARDVFGRDHVATFQYVTRRRSPTTCGSPRSTTACRCPRSATRSTSTDLRERRLRRRQRPLQRARPRPRDGLRYTQNLRPTATWRHRLLLGVEQRPIDNQVGLVDGSDDLSPDITLNPAASATPAAGASRAGRSTCRSPPCTTCRAARAAKARPSRRLAPAPAPTTRCCATPLRAQQALPYDWQVRVAFDGQYTGDALVSGEQYGIGGQDSVRGFDERELIDDRGNRATLELQTPDFGERIGGGVFARALVFLDHGWLHRNHPLPGRRPPPHRQCRLGVRLTMPPSWNLRVDVSRVAQGTDAARAAARRSASASATPTDGLTIAPGKIPRRGESRWR
jgi:hypothetical protein